MSANNNWDMPTIEIVPQPGALINTDPSLLSFVCNYSEAHRYLPPSKLLKFSVHIA